MMTKVADEIRRVLEVRIMAKVAKANPRVKTVFHGHLIYNDLKSLIKIRDNVVVTPEGDIDCSDCSLMNPEYKKHGGIKMLKAITCDRLEE